MNINHVKILERAGLFRYINPDDYETVSDELAATPMKFVNNQIIFRQQDRTAQIAVVLDGVVKAEKIHGRGSGNMVHTFKDGEMFAYEGIFSGSKDYPVDYISDGDSKVLIIDVEHIRSNAYADELMRGIMVRMADDSIRRMHRIETISKNKLRDRILTYLKIKSSEVGSSTVVLDMSREELALELCVNRSALSNELSAMKRDRVIEIDKKKITLL